MKGQSLKSDGNTVAVNLDVILETEHGITTAYCPALELSSYGDDEDDAQKSFEVVLQDFLEYTMEKGTLERELLRLGWTLKQVPEPQYRPPARNEAITKKIGSSQVHLIEQPVLFRLSA